MAKPAPRGRGAGLRPPRSAGRALGAAFASLLVACAPSAHEDGIGVSLRGATVASAEASAARVVITKTDSYWTSLSGSFTIETGNANHSDSGLFVISGTLRNASEKQIRRVRLEFQLIDGRGRPVYVERGVNRLAEETVELSDAELADGPAINLATIAAGATDSYRMIFLGNEIPDFDRVRVRIVSTQ